MSRNTPLLRQWRLVERLGAAPIGLTVRELAQQSKVNEKTIRRDLILLKRVGMPVVEEVGDFGRKYWRIVSKEAAKPHDRYAAIENRLDHLISDCDQIGDSSLADTLRVVRRHVAATLVKLK